MELKELMNMPIVFTSVENYNEMSIEWVEKYAKKHNFEFDDVMSALHLDKDANREEYIFSMKGELDLIKKISISLIQRRLKIGFNDAYNVMDNLIKESIVSTREYDYHILDRERLKLWFEKQ